MCINFFLVLEALEVVPEKKTILVKEHLKKNLRTNEISVVSITVLITVNGDTLIILS